ILRACLTETSGETARSLAAAAPPGGLETLPVVASFHRVVGHVTEALGGVVPPDVAAALERLHRDELARKLIAAANLRRSDRLLLFFEHLRRATRISMEDVFARARSVTVDGVEVRTPDAVDTLIHLALHACLAGGGRFVWLKDIEQAVANDRPAWEEVVRRSF